MQTEGSDRSGNKRWPKQRRNYKKEKSNESFPRRSVSFSYLIMNSNHRSNQSIGVGRWFARFQPTSRKPARGRRQKKVIAGVFSENSRISRTRYISKLVDLCSSKPQTINGPSFSCICLPRCFSYRIFIYIWRYAIPRDSNTSLDCWFNFEQTNWLLLSTLACQLLKFNFIAVGLVPD